MTRVGDAGSILIYLATMEEIWRRFERVRNGRGDFWEIRHEGIRCQMRWGRLGSPPRGSTSVRDTAEDAARHAAAKVRAKLRDGFAEVEPVVVEVKPRYRGGEAVEGFPGVVRSDLILDLQEYLVPRAVGAVRFVVSSASADHDTVATFLRFVTAHRDLPVDGSTHHKLPLTEQVGRFTHALFTYPVLARAGDPRVGGAFPIFDEEIGDEDTEVLIDARTSGRRGLRIVDWAREPQPVTDLRFDVTRATPSNGQWPADTRPVLRERTFKVYSQADLARLRACLADSTEGSWVEHRAFDGTVRRLPR